MLNLFKETGTNGYKWICGNDESLHVFFTSSYQTGSSGVQWLSDPLQCIDLVQCSGTMVQGAFILKKYIGQRVENTGQMHCEDKNNDLSFCHFFESSRQSSELYGVGPVDNRPSTDQLHHFGQFFLRITFFFVFLF